MPGITSFGAYIPFYRLAHKEIARAGGGRASDGERSVANVDEDSVTMAVEAVRDLLAGREGSTLDGLLFATTTSPYAEKQASAVIANAADLRHDVRTADYTDSTRAGTSAILAAVDAVKAASASNVAVAAADTRLAQPRSAGERMFGDAAAAIELGRERVAAELVASHSVVDEMVDFWRAGDERFVSNWEERFAVTQGYQRVVKQTIEELFERNAVGPSEISKAIFYAPDPGTLAATAKSIGLKPEQVADHLFGSVGNTGAAMPLFVLSSVLEDAKPGEKLLVAGYGSGCDALLFEVTDQIVAAQKSPQRGVKGYLNSKTALDSYEKYARFKELIEVEAPRRQLPSASAAQTLRKRDEIYRLHGSRCLNCNKVQYPQQRVCISCQTRDSFETVKLSNKRAELFTYTIDFLNADLDPPTVMCIVDFEGGGRNYMMMTDRNPSEVRIGQQVEMTFRRIYEADGFINYYWKCRPLR